MLSKAVRAADRRRDLLRRSIKLLVLFATLLMLYVFIDFSFNQVKLNKEYRFEIPQLISNRPVVLLQESMIIILAHYNDDLLNDLPAISEQADSITSRIDASGHFVALAYGTDMGCPVSIAGERLKETCSLAQYDLLGRSLQPDAYRDLEIPRYRWDKNFTAITIYQE